ncbi:uncharacterized protein LOC117323546 isoform X2 [Pecten maximus]|uniref:uncharacterized protein LOC117323546 isoform X2 n=1 Tax=Pecten maximus TaxID=6579 RepID=UPI00145808E9|nr:uncharacterized protein LOC117323546 isoform X2 [Pecten maximus]
MPYQKMNLSGQAIYAPKKVYLSKSLSDSPQAPEGEEKTGEPAENQPVIDNMFEIQSREFLSLFGQPNAIPKTFCTSSSGSGQYIVNSTGHGHYAYPHMDKETDQQQLESYLPSSPNSFPGLLSSVINSNGSNLPSLANTSFQRQHSFVTSSNDTNFLPYTYYSKGLDSQMPLPNTSQVSVIMSQMTSVNEEDKLSSVLNTSPVPSVISSQVFSVNATDSSSKNINQSSSTIVSQSSSMNSNHFLPVNASQTSSMNGSQVPSVVNISHAFSGNPSQTSVNDKQVSSVNVSQASFVTSASCFVQNSSINSYNACQFLSPQKDSDSDQVLPGIGVVTMEPETTGNNERLDTLKNSKYIEQQLVSSSLNVSQTFTTTSSVGGCDSTQSPIGLINSPESWTFSPLVPFNLSHDSYDECSVSPFPVGPELTSDSTLDLLESEVKTPVSVSKDISDDEPLSNTAKNSTYSTMTWAQRYGINVKAKLKKPPSSRQPFNRVSLADIEEFSVKKSAGKRKTVVQSSNNTLLGPTQPKKQFESPVKENSIKNQVVCSDSTSVISSSQVSSTNMNQDLSPKGSDEGQNKMLMELFPMPSSTSDVLTVTQKMCKADEEDSYKISSTGGTSDCVRTPGCEAFCQVCGDKAAGFYCGAFICEACKKFFMRASKLEKIKYVCLRVQKCVITKESRVQCQYCRFQKCLSLKMYCPGTGDSKKKDKKIGEIPCRVCSAPSSGFHFGALTCEGCKGFFRRMAKERECQRYKCSKNGNCDVNTVTRNLCKACRYRKCLESGMSIEGSRIGRQPNSIKHAISIEAEKQGKNLCKEQAFGEKININDMKAMVTTAIPATAEELAEINLDIRPEQLDLKNIEIDIKTQQVTAPEKCDLDVTPLLIGSSEIKLEPKSPIAKTVSPESSTDCEKTWEILNKCSGCNEELEHLLPVNTDSEEDELMGYLSVKTTWTSMMSSFEHTARTLIKFSKKVPGFRALSLDDQIKLVQGSIYPIVVLNCSRSFDNETKQYSYFNFTPRQREAIHSFFPMLRILSSHFIHTGSMVKLMNLSTMEYTFLSILLLLNAVSGEPGFSSHLS